MQLDLPPNDRRRSNCMPRKTAQPVCGRRAPVGSIRQAKRIPSRGRSPARPAAAHSRGDGARGPAAAATGTAPSPEESFRIPSLLTKGLRRQERANRVIRPTRRQRLQLGGDLVAAEPLQPHDCIQHVLRRDDGVIHVVLRDGRRLPDRRDHRLPAMAGSSDPPSVAVSAASLVTDAWRPPLACSPASRRTTASATSRKKALVASWPPSPPGFRPTFSFFIQTAPFPPPLRQQARRKRKDPASTKPAGSHRN
jgi:hypothetical protein